MLLRLSCGLSCGTRVLSVTQLRESCTLSPAELVAHKSFSLFFFRLSGLYLSIRCRYHLHSILDGLLRAIDTLERELQRLLCLGLRCYKH